MPNYQQSKIYKIVNDDDDEVYIGSTTKKYLCERFANHKALFKMYVDKKPNIGYCSSYRLFSKTNPHILLIETYPCNSRDELHVREQFHIKNTLHCINIIKDVGAIAIKGGLEKYYKDKCSEYYYSHYHECRTKQNIYRLKNIDKIKAHKNKKVQCTDCGIFYCNSSKGQHIKSKKHQNCFIVTIKRDYDDDMKKFEADKKTFYDLCRKIESFKK